ncbi:WD40 repeat domain-containing protein [Nonomuraea sp. NPDC005692]|uniref:WD40 repeat domain-containing protein n=1 Tax=Nonomuraea sp. NPDC005692 TaxID=3157168 RepID=UPI0033C2AA26
MARFGSLLRALAGTVLQIQQTLSRQDAERQLHQSQGQRQIALLLSVHEQLAELVLRLPEMGGAAPYRGLDNPMAPSAAWVGLCPYQGLAPFGPAEARVFYGRGLAVARLLTMVATHTGEGPIIVTGASGAGKSSLLHAGLLPQLSTTAADSLAATYGTTGWPQITFTPGPRPLQQLAIHLAVRCGADIDQVLAELRADPTEAVVRRAKQVLAAEQIRRSASATTHAEAPTSMVQGGQRLIVVVDQFEELFTLAAGYAPPVTDSREPDSRQETEQFLAALAALTARPDIVMSTPSVPPIIEPSASRDQRGLSGTTDQLPVGIAMLVVRGDFIDRCSAYPLLAHALEEKTFVLGPMTEQELQRAITGPAAAAGLRIEDGLAKQVVDDLIGHLRTTSAQSGLVSTAAISGDVAALPLLSMAMARTWKQREGVRLTYASYDRAGGVASAVTDTAEDTYNSLNEPQQRAAHRILLALTITSADGRISRRRVTVKELAQLVRSDPSLAREPTGQTSNSRQAEQVIEAFTTARLLITTSVMSTGRPPEPAPGPAAVPTARSARPPLLTGTAAPAASERPPATSSQAPADGGQSAAVELAHDVLLTAWPRLRAWLGEDQDDRILHSQLVHDAAEWDRRSRNPAFLYRGSRLEEARAAVARWRADPDRHPALGLSNAAHTFLEDGARVAARSRRRWRSAAGVLATLLIISVVTAVAAIRFGRDADQQRAEADHQRAMALDRSAQILSRLIAGYSDSELIAEDPATSARLAAAAWSILPSAEVSASMASLLSRPQRAVLSGHADIVTSVAASPDGTRIASGSADETVRIWDARTGQPISEPLTGHTGDVQSVVFSPDGTRLASGSNDETVRIWDARTGQPIGRPLTGHTEWVTSVAYSPDGARLASASGDGTVRIWDARIGNPIGKALTGHTDVVQSVVFSPDGTRLASGSNDETVRIWDARTGQPIGKPLTGHTEWVTSVAYSPDGARLASASGDGTVRIWDARIGNPIGKALTGHTANMWSVVYSPDGARLASTDDKTVRIWDARTGQPIGKPLTGHTEWVTSVAYSPDGARLASASGDGTVRIWDARTSRPIGKPLTGHTEGVTSVAYSPDGTRLASGSNDKTVRIWDAHTGRPIGEPLTGHTDGVSSVAFSPDGTRLASGGDGTDKSVRMWNARTGVPIGRPLTGHTDGVPSVAFSPDGNRLASGGGVRGDQTVRIWDVQTGRAIGRPMIGHSHEVSSVVFSPDGTRLASSSPDGTVRIWDVALPKDLLGAVCGIAGRGFTLREWQQYVPEAPYQATCPTGR